MAEFERTGAQLEIMTGDLGLSQGAQVYVSRGGRPLLDVAVGEDGLGRPMTPDHLIALYCTTKPVLALALAVLESRGLLDLDAPLCDVLPDVTLAPALQRVSPRDILNHTAGLQQVQGIHANFVPATRWAEVAASTPPAAGFRPGADAAYSEWQGWTLLGLLAEAVGGRDCTELLRREVITPLGLANDLFVPMTPREHVAYYDRLAINVDLRGATPVPMLMERTRRVATAPNPGFGGYGSARAMGRFHQGLLDVAGGTSNGGLTPDVVRRCTTPSRPRMHDQVLERECSFGLGFMVGLHDHDFGRRCSRSAWGHSGNAGLSLAFADPDHDLSVAVVWNGLIDASSALTYRRRQVVDAIYHDLGITDRPSTVVPAAGEPAPGRPEGRRRLPWRSR